MEAAAKARTPLLGPSGPACAMELSYHIHSGPQGNPLPLPGTGRAPLPLPQLPLPAPSHPPGAALSLSLSPMTTGWVAAGVWGAAGAHRRHLCARLPRRQRRRSHRWHHQPGLAHAGAGWHSWGTCPCPAGREDPTLPGVPGLREQPGGLPAGQCRCCPGLTPLPRHPRSSCWGGWTCRTRPAQPSIPWCSRSATSTRRHQRPRVWPGNAGRAAWAGGDPGPTPQRWGLSPCPQPRGRAVVQERWGQGWAQRCPETPAWAELGEGPGSREKGTFGTCLLLGCLIATPSPPSPPCGQS